jgi:hypothetical protein
MVSPDTAWPSGASGIAVDAETAARLRQMANADATSIFMGSSFPFKLSSQICRVAAIYALTQNIAAACWRTGASPPMTMPVAVPATVMPAVPTPVPAVPVVVPVMAPAHLFGLEAVDFVRAGHGRTQFFIDGRRPLVLG